MHSFVCVKTVLNTLSTTMVNLEKSLDKFQKVWINKLVEQNGASKKKQFDETTKKSACGRLSCPFCYALTVCNQEVTKSLWDTALQKVFQLKANEMMACEYFFFNKMLDAEREWINRYRYLHYVACLRSLVAWNRGSFTINELESVINICSCKYLHPLVRLVTAYLSNYNGNRNNMVETLFTMLNDKERTFLSRHFQTLKKIRDVKKSQCS